MTTTSLCTYARSCGCCSCPAACSPCCRALADSRRCPAAGAAGRGGASSSSSRCARMVNLRPSGSSRGGATPSCTMKWRRRELRPPPPPAAAPLLPPCSSEVALAPFKACSRSSRAGREGKGYTAGRGGSRRGCGQSSGIAQCAIQPGSLAKQPCKMRQIAAPTCFALHSVAVLQEPEARLGPLPSSCHRRFAATAAAALPHKSIRVRPCAGADVGAALRLEAFCRA